MIVFVFYLMVNLGGPPHMKINVSALAMCLKQRRIKLQIVHVYSVFVGFSFVTLNAFREVRLIQVMCKDVLLLHRQNLLLVGHYVVTSE